MARIMIVDDLAFIKVVQRDILEKHGHEVVADASNGQEAIENYVQTKPDIVLMDITMPEVNGLEALQKILEIDPNANVVMCSALGQQNLIVEAIEKGAKDFIVKPFTPERLLAVIDKILGQ
ncbi:MAG: response regulator [Candidatus Hydrogenedentota bacterium]|nr:MAG: response regulator [Candidatus Hydrogenedentota bacterium]